jgi:hypothetical protein
MACAGQTGDTGQAGGQSKNRNTPNTQHVRKKNPGQSLAKQHQNNQELTSNSTT